MNKKIYILAVSLYQRLGIGRILAIMRIGSFEKRMTHAIERFVPAAEQADHAFIHQLKKDIRWCYVKYQVNPQEYFLFGFVGKTPQDRTTFLPDALRNKVLRERFGWKLFEELEDKYQFYQLNKEYFKRGVMLITPETSFSQFSDFISFHKQVFLKPLSASCGNGTRIYEYSNEVSAKDFFHEIQMGGVIICLKKGFDKTSVWRLGTRAA